MPTDRAARRWVEPILFGVFAFVVFFGGTSLAYWLLGVRV